MNINFNKGGYASLSPLEITPGCRGGKVSLEESRGTKSESLFILHVVAIKWTMHVQENIEPPSMSQRPRLSSSIISGDFSLATTIMQ